MADTNPPIPVDYTSRDYASIRADLLNAIPDWMPEWTNRSETDFGVVLIEMMSYVGDVLGYYIDRAANEAFLTTAVQRASVLSLAQMLAYRPTGIEAASTTLSFSVSAFAPDEVTIPAGTQVSTRAGVGETPIIFETDADLTVPVGGVALVSATEGRSVEEPTASPVGISTGAADQAFPLYHRDIVGDSLVVLVDEDAEGAQGALPWTFRSHLIDAGGGERAYSTVIDENGITYVLFGDDVNGRIPTKGAVITARYRVGAGADGNVGAHTLVEMVEPIIGVESVTNVTVGSGGADVESIESIRVNAPRNLAALERAVTLSDYEALARKVGGVLHTKATAAVYTNVILYIVPLGGGLPSEDKKNEVIDYLADKRMINTSLTVLDPTYVDINVAVSPLRVLPQYDREAVENAVHNAIVKSLSVEQTGFGHRVTLSEIYRAIQSVAGVDYAVVTALNRTGAGLVDGVVLDDHEVPDVGAITITATGGLTGS